MLTVTDRDGFVLGKVEATVGMQTVYGVKISRVGEKSIWTVTKEGYEHHWRPQNARLPSIYQSHAGRNWIRN